MVHRLLLLRYAVINESEEFDGETAIDTFLLYSFATISEHTGRRDATGIAMKTGKKLW